MKFTLTIETDLEGVTPRDVFDAINYEVSWGMSVVENDNYFYELSSNKNTRILSCEEVEQDSDCQHEDYFKGH